MTRNIGIRPSLPTSSTAIEPRGDLSGSSFARAAQLAIYDRAQGAVVVPWCGSSSTGSAYNAGVSSETFRFAYWSSGVHFHRQWSVRFRWNSAGEVTLAVGSASVTVNLGYKQETTALRNSPLQEDTITFNEYFTASSGRHTLSLQVSGASGSSWAVADIHCIEVPRSVLAKDTSDLGLNASSISTDSPIRGDANESWRGIYDIARTPTIKRGALYSLALGNETVASNMIALQGFTAGSPTAILFDDSIVGPIDDYPRMTAPIINSSASDRTRIGVSAYYEFSCSVGTISTVTFSWDDSFGNTYTKTGSSTGGAGGTWVHFDVTGSGAPLLSHDDESSWTATDTLKKLAFTITSGGAVTGNLGIKSLCIYEVP